MGGRHFKPEQIIHMLHEAEIKLTGTRRPGKSGYDFSYSPIAAGHIGALLLALSARDGAGSRTL